MTKETLTLALEALTVLLDEWTPARQAQLKGMDAVTAIKEALAQPEQPAPMQGWKLVPVEPTNDMWKAVNKLDDEMAAGGYDGKGCSIEQAWNCLLDATPTPPQRKPLTDEQIEKLFKAMHGEPYPNDLYAFARAIEAAHGIKE